MKVLVVMNSTSVKLGGGIIQVIINYRDQLIGSNIYFDFAINIDNDEELVRKLTCNGEKLYQLPNKKKRIAQYIKELYGICRYGEYDVVHVHGNSATMSIELTIAKLCGIKKRVVHCHNSQGGHPKLNKLLMPYFKTLYMDALACSDSAGEWIFGKGNFTVLHNAIDLERFSFNNDDRIEYRKKLQISEDTIVVGHVGSLNEQKNHEFLIKIFSVFQKTNNAELLIIGDGVLRNKIAQQAIDLGIADKVNFLGVQNDVEKWMCVMDIFAFPSKWEGLGMVAIEAQACGLPVLASTAVPKAACVTNKMYYLSLKDSEKIWSDKMAELILGHKDRVIDKQKFKSYDISNERHNLIKIYQG